jgi:hypothetical protein
MRCEICGKKATYSSSELNIFDRVVYHEFCDVHTPKEIRESMVKIQYKLEGIIK